MADALHSESAATFPPKSETTSSCIKIRHQLDLLPQKKAMEKTKVPETKLPIRSSYDGGMDSDRKGGGVKGGVSGSSKLERTGAPGLEIMESRSLFL